MKTTPTRTKKTGSANKISNQILTFHHDTIVKMAQTPISSEERPSTKQKNQNMKINNKGVKKIN